MFPSAAEGTLGDTGFVSFRGTDIWGRVFFLPVSQRIALFSSAINPDAFPSLFCLLGRMSISVTSASFGVLGQREQLQQRRKEKNHLLWQNEERNISSCFYFSGPLLIHRHIFHYNNIMYACLAGSKSGIKC